MPFKVGALILSVVLASAAFPPWEWSAGGWLFLVPLILAGRLSGRIIWLFGLAGFWAWLATIGWVHHVTWPGTVVLCAYLGTYWMVWGWLWQWLCRDIKVWSSWKNLTIAFWAATGWVALDFVRSNLFSGFPWNKIGVSQYDHLPLVQLASLGGVDLISWLMIFVNATLALSSIRLFREIRREQRVKSHWDFSMAAVLIGISLIWGTRQIIRPPVPTEPLEVVMVQGNVPQYEKFTSEWESKIIGRYIRYTQLAAAHSPDLIVWPETATGSTFFRDITFTSEIQSLIKQVDYSLLVGALDYEEENYYNAAFLLNAQQGDYQIYRKQHLVPFGEFLPGRRWMPWLENWIPIPMDYYPGEGSEILNWQKQQRQIPLGILICFEDVMAYLGRQRAKEGARLLVNLTNDGWFKDSSAAWQHAINALFRCVETGLPMIRSANTGVSCVIDTQGRMTHILTNERGKKIEVEGFLRAIVPVPSEPRPTIFLRGGYFFPLFCFIITGIFLAYEFYRFRRVGRAARALRAAQEVSLTSQSPKPD